jgi:hypothetical protein
MRRRTLLVVLAGLAVVLAAGAVVQWPRTSHPTILRRNDSEFFLAGRPVRVNPS